MTDKTFFAIVTCRNSQEIIEKALLSLLKQTISPEMVIVINDGSTDNTGKILYDLQTAWPEKVRVITHPDMGYDVTRIVRNWNEALDYYAMSGRQMTGYHLIATDDTQYPPDYIETLINYMENVNPKCAVASGEYNDKARSRDPHGAGRLVKNQFFYNHVENCRYPDRIGYESWLLFRAALAGYECGVVPNARFNHVRPLGANHKFREFGSSMKALGYHPLYAIGRCGLALLRGGSTGRIGSLYMLYYYLTFQGSELLGSYNSFYDRDTRAAIRAYTRKKILSSLLAP